MTSVRQYVHKMWCVNLSRKRLEEKTLSRSCNKTQMICEDELGEQKLKYFSTVRKYITVYYSGVLAPTSGNSALVTQWIRRDVNELESKSLMDSLKSCELTRLPLSSVMELQICWLVLKDKWMQDSLESLRIRCFCRIIKGGGVEKTPQTKDC